jgi:hypothetical protein
MNIEMAMKTGTGHMGRCLLLELSIRRGDAEQ